MAETKREKTRISCHSCPLHCPVAKSDVAPQGPYPELLLNGATPSDAQTHVIASAIESAEKDMSATDEHIARLQRTLEQLIRHRVDLEDFINVHRGMVSAMRRFPTELLAEIFEHCAEPLAPFDPHCDTPWVIAQVCNRWRVVALASPQLWRHFFLPNWLDVDVSPPILRTLSLRLERAGPAPLSFNYATGPLTLDLLNIFLGKAAQWESVALEFGDDEVSCFFDYSGTFPILKTLALRSWHQLPNDIDMLASFPAMKSLELNVCNELFPRRLRLPWAQLTTCTLTRFGSGDILWILSQLSPGTHVSISAGSNLAIVHSSPETSPIRSLSISSCTDAFATDLFDSLIAPALETLEYVVHWDREDRIRPLLDRSACPLRHLRIRVSHPDHLTQILQSPYSRDLVTLDVTVDAINIIDALQAQDLLPHLRTLVLRGEHTLKRDALLILLASRQPVIRVVPRFEASQHVSEQAGLDVVFVED